MFFLTTLYTGEVKERGDVEKSDLQPGAKINDVF